MAGTRPFHVRGPRRPRRKPLPQPRPPLRTAGRFGAPLRPHLRVGLSRAPSREHSSVRGWRSAGPHCCLCGPRGRTRRRERPAVRSEGGQHHSKREPPARPSSAAPPSLLGSGTGHRGSKGRGSGRDPHRPALPTPGAATRSISPAAGLEHPARFPGGKPLAAGPEAVRRPGRRSGLRSPASRAPDQPPESPEAAEERAPHAQHSRAPRLRSRDPPCAVLRLPLGAAA